MQPVGDANRASDCYMCASHQQSDPQSFTSFFWHRQVTRVHALSVAMEMEARLEAGDISSHSEVDG